MSIKNYKEKALYHLKNKLSDKFIVRKSIHGNFKGNLEFICFEEPVTIFPNWKKCYEYLKVFTKSTKRKWVEGLKNRGVISVIWDTDLETYEQELIKDIQEIYDYKYSSLDTYDLSEIIGDLTDEMQQKAITDLIYSMEYLYKKDAIEME
tara:strand:+ start:107 stop:556 length:450 start_codon:yes stop_codon:yes gene_type:complete